MRAYYGEILAAFAEEPRWWDVFGVPRWVDPPPALVPLMGRIRCQGCAAIFTVCLVDEVYYGLYGEMLTIRFTGKCPHDPQAYHAATELQKMNTYDGATGRFVAKPLPPDWHYGDPPAHNCVGDTMNSIPEYAWDDDERE